MSIPHESERDALLRRLDEAKRAFAEAGAAYAMAHNEAHQAGIVIDDQPLPIVTPEYEEVRLIAVLVPWVCVVGLQRAAAALEETEEPGDEFEEWERKHVSRLADQLAALKDEVLDVDGLWE